MFGFEIVATSKILGAINQLEKRIMAAIDDLTREVAENKSAMDSAATLLANIKQKLDDAIAAGDMSKVQELSDQLSTNTDTLVAAVTKNTPVEGQP